MGDSALGYEPALTSLNTTPSFSVTSTAKGAGESLWSQIYLELRVRIVSFTTK